MSQHEQQHPDGMDKFEEKVLEGEFFLERHGKKLLIAGIAIVVVALGIFAYHRFVKLPRKEKATAQLFVAEDQFLAGQESLALKGQAGFEAIAKNFSGTDAANLAHAYSGICLYDEGKYQQALDELKKFSSDETLVAPSIQRMIGDCYVQLGKLEEAVKAYESAAKQASSEAISPSCLIKAGHVYEKLGKADKAIAAYKEVKEKYYNTPEAQTVEADLMRAQAQGK